MRYNQKCTQCKNNKIEIDHDANYRKTMDKLFFIVEQQELTKCREQLLEKTNLCEKYQSEKSLWKDAYNDLLRKFDYLKQDINSPSNEKEKICLCGDHTKNQDGECDTCNALNPNEEEK